MIATDQDSYYNVKHFLFIKAPFQLFAIEED